MKRLIGAVMAVVLLVSVAPVLAGDSFYALSRLPAGLSPLDDAQLATAEGGQDGVFIGNHGRASGNLISNNIENG